MVFTSPIKALKFLKDHTEDIDFALVAVNMKEMHGFEFLDISRELLMSDEITWPTMNTSVELGARFLIQKPLGAETINDLWQHLDIRNRREKIEDLFRGIEGKSDDVFKSDNKFRESANKQKVTQLLWTPFLQQKFLQALELLGEAATPKMIHLIMNVNSIDRTQVSAHLQKHRKKIEKELRNSSVKKCSNGASSSQPNTSQYDPEIQSVDNSDEDMSWDQTESSNEIQGKNSMIEAMRRALRLGTVFIESQLRTL
ncbi:hypothetical protein PVAP13_7KG077365 [Panicum virgatum]|uniref:Response regulatory domain-containing protein n=1 Tax=Panicum virgatum TaxID=38727 RepID=A0A8T0Q903_PANVG|nr:hypothetical protein PVAP13_7KG077365 [Panicum virgatum]